MQLICSLKKRYTVYSILFHRTETGQRYLIYWISKGIKANKDNKQQPRTKVRQFTEKQQQKKPELLEQEKKTAIKSFFYKQFEIVHISRVSMPLKL